ncbi:hypothetical protein Tco_0211388 [Tanacetum coccineum]
MLSPCSKYWLWTKRLCYSYVVVQRTSVVSVLAMMETMLHLLRRHYSLPLEDTLLLSLLPEETLLLTLPHEETLLLTLSLEETLLLTSCADTASSSLPLDLRWPSSPQLLKRTVVTWSGFVLEIL